MSNWWETDLTPFRFWLRVSRLKARRYARIVEKTLVSDKRKTEQLFFEKKGYALDLNNVQTFSEKLSFLKLYNRNPLMKICADKYYVQEYVKACGFGNTLKEVYGVYDSVKDIDINVLPDSFFLKTNHGSGLNLFVESKGQIDFKRVLKLIDINLKMDYSYARTRELCYRGISTKVIIEQPLLNRDGSLPIDYKFYCFSGQPRYYMVSYGEYNHQKRNHKFDMNGNSIDYLFKKESTVLAEDIVLPYNFSDMVDMVKKLCEPFPHVRVDLYNIEGKIYFGELTFFSDGGVVNMYSAEYEKTVGSWIDLNKYVNDIDPKMRVSIKK